MSVWKSLTSGWLSGIQQISSAVTWVPLRGVEGERYGCVEGCLASHLTRHDLAAIDIVRGNKSTVRIANQCIITSYCTNRFRFQYLQRRTVYKNSYVAEFFLFCARPRAGEDELLLHGQTHRVWSKHVCIVDGARSFDWYVSRCVQWCGLVGPALDTAQGRNEELILDEKRGNRERGTKGKRAGKGGGGWPFMPCVYLSNAYTATLALIVLHVSANMDQCLSSLILTTGMRAL